MIIGILHKGSGLGDQLFSYIATRVRAADLGVPFGFVGKEFWKGKGWMDIDFGEPVNLKHHIDQTGKLIIDEPHKLFEINTPYYNPEFNFIPDGSVIDGYGAQDERYFEHRLDEVREWLTDPRFKDPSFSGALAEDTCIINFRGGEYATIPDLFLIQDYWDKAIDKMKKEHPQIKYFWVITDDMETARKFFPKLHIIHDEIRFDWGFLWLAQYLILSNSAFGILPALLGHSKEVIAPFGWNARNKSLTKWEGRPGNYYKKFTYI